LADSAVQQTLLIRADASVAMGTGHVMRCLALAQAWQDAGGKVVFAVKHIPAFIAEKLQRESILFFEIYAEPGTGDDSERTIVLAREAAADWIVVDGYHFKPEYQKTLSAHGIRTLFLEDGFQEGHCWAHVILNQNISASESAYADREPYTRLLLGPKYCLLRREFTAWTAWQRQIPPIGRHVLITMGGSDPGNFTEKVIYALALMDDKEIEATIVVGGSNPRAGLLEDAARKSGKRINLRHNVTNMAELMSWADVAISAAGTTCWEMCLLALPSLLIDVADNQMAIAQELDRRGCARHLGGRNNVTPEKIAENLKQLLESSEIRQAMARCCRQLVDARGAGRVVSILRGEEMHLRAAEQNDIHLLWEWANDPQVRAVAFSPQPISWEMHEAWFDEKLTDSNCRILIAEDAQGTPIGQFRTDKRSTEDADISISIACKFRGRGLGRMLIERGVAVNFSEGQLMRLHAFVKPENLASRRSFESVGFEKLGEECIKGLAAIHYLFVKGA
jgi:UDP-2,4-diacetamido-2,4,6-trideoxy-beta-L-altropyranose hydrolase